MPLDRRGRSWWCCGDVGIREYMCRLCNYKGVTQSDLNRHTKSQIHLMKARNECVQCSEGFVSPMNLEQHRQDKHPTSNSAAPVVTTNDEVFWCCAGDFTDVRQIIGDSIKVYHRHLMVERERENGIFQWCNWLLIPVVCVQTLLFYLLPWHVFMTFSVCVSQRILYAGYLLMACNSKLLIVLKTVFYCWSVFGVCPSCCPSCSLHSFLFLNCQQGLGEEGFVELKPNHFV